MPIVAVTTESRRFDLKSAPPDGYIMAKPLNYGQKKDRADIAGRVYSEMRDNAKRTRDNNDDEPQKMFIESASRAAMIYDFTTCITDHNLEDANGRKLDFSKQSAYDVLPGTVGEEIETILSKINGDDESDADDKDFFVRPLNSQTPSESPTPSAA